MSEIVQAVREFLVAEEPPSQAEPEPSEYPKKGQSGSGLEDGWSVEARFTYHEPRQFGKQIFDQRWKSVQFDQVVPPIGVPSGPPSVLGIRDACGLYGYQAAQALRWWFHANAAARWQDGCLETRLVKHLLKYEFSSTAESAHAVIGGDDRSGMKPLGD